jgi:16S rRNA (uracil1498-N3)-methyltransferase
MTLRLFVGAPEPAAGGSWPTVLARCGPGAPFELPAGAVRHAQVRRVQPGDVLQLFDGHGQDWSATVQAMGRTRVQVTLGEPRPVATELRCAVTLAVGMPANERMDALVEKAAELGVAALQPLQCERAVLRLDGERAERRRAHWQAVAVAACEQCGRAVVPVVRPVATLPAWIAALPAPDAAARRWLLSAPGPQAGRPDGLDPGSDGGSDAGSAARPATPRPPQPALPPPPGAALLALSGPEGGLTPAEQALAARAGFEPVRLGPRVLRADTAPLVVLAWVGLQGGG